MSIPRIGINQIGTPKLGTQNIWNVRVDDTYTTEIPNVYIPSWMTTQPNVDYLLPPVVVNIGNPIADIPGCVKAHKDNKQHKTGIPIDKDLVENDSKNAMTLCPDGSYPAYSAMNYEPEQLLMTYESEPPPVAPPPPPTGGPDLTMDNLQTSKFKIDLKTMIYVGSLLVSGITMYFTFMAELDARFAALEGNDKDLMVEIDKRLTDLENTFTPIGDGVYTVDPNSTWPPSRGEYKMKDEMSRNKIIVLEETIDRLEKELEKIEDKLDKKADKQ